MGHAAAEVPCLHAELDMQRAYDSYFSAVGHFYRIVFRGGLGTVPYIFHFSSV